MHYEMRSTYPIVKGFDWLKIDPDALLFKALCGIVCLSLAWPLVFLGYLVTVYGVRILAW